MLGAREVPTAAITAGDERHAEGLPDDGTAPGDQAVVDDDATPVDHDRGPVAREVTAATPSHAAHTTLAGLSLWMGQPLSVVLCAGEVASSFARNLYDDFGFGAATAHDQVAIVEPGRRGLGSFRELRQLDLRGVR